MGFNFIACDLDRAFLLPQDVREWLPPEHLCWKVLDAVGEVDLSAFMAGYRSDGQGRAAYPPGVLLALVLYCYSKGVRASRRIEQACLDDVGCRIITGNRRVDHATVARFIRRHRLSLKALFVQVLALCGQRGLVDLSAVAVDGSPMEANAGRESNRSLERLEAIIRDGEAELDQMVQDALAHARAAETDEVPAPVERQAADTSLGQLSRLSDRILRARAAMEQLHQRALPSAGEIKIKVEAAERIVARAEKRLGTEMAAHQARLNEYAERTVQDRAAGHRAANGRPPVALDVKTVIVRQRARLATARAGLERARNPRPVPSPAARASLSDPDSSLMPHKRGGYLQGFNLQIVCARGQFLLAIELQDNPSDMTALVPMVGRTQENCRSAGITDEVRAWLADSGYASTSNFEALAGLPLLVALKNDTHPGDGEPPPSEAIPAGQRDMAARLASPTGQSLYKQRAALVEPGFAQLFQRFGRQLHYRGTDAVDAEIKLLDTVHNLNKLFRQQTKHSP
ncbi:transposase [Kitasatospora purpeofusca]|uniref:transposase n=1 Tax=Kitasatospora purpeofusca TaxID=67352 RepID=UPI002A5A7D67|nr:transposase [Kitasatospora purpeofusca]MDY0810576.1 transposase [Kitasatospora purpeofusca]